MAEEKAKKPIYKKWWFWVIVVVVIVVIGANSGGGNSSNSTSAGSNDAKQEAKQEAPKQEAKKELSKEGVASDVKFVVNGAEVSKSIGTNPYSKKDASGTFKIVTISITNNQKDAITMDSNLFKLIDDQGREFSPSSEAQTAIMVDDEKDSLFLKEINPGLTITGKIAFDVPADAKGFKLKARGGMTGKEIELKVD